VSLAVETQITYATEPHELVFLSNSQQYPVVFVVTEWESIDSQPALSAAIVLAGLEPEIRFVEKLLGVELEFGLPGNESGAFDNMFSLAGKAASGVNLRIVLPAQVLLQSGNDRTTYPELPDGFFWVPTQAELCVSKISAGEFTPGQSEPGAVLLLPESFTRHWHVEYLFNDFDIRIECLFDPKEFTCRLSEIDYGDTLIDPASTEPDTYFVTIKNLPDIAPATLLHNKEINTGFNLNRMSCLLGRGNEVLAEGNLVEIGRGFGFCIDAVVSDNRTYTNMWFLAC